MTVTDRSPDPGSSVSAWFLSCVGSEGVWAGDVPGPAELTALGLLLPVPGRRFEDQLDQAMETLGQLSSASVPKAPTSDCTKQV